MKFNDDILLYKLHLIKLTKALEFIIIISICITKFIGKTNINKKSIKR